MGFRIKPQRGGTFVEEHINDGILHLLFIRNASPRWTRQPCVNLWQCKCVFYWAGGSKPMKTLAVADTNKQTIANSGKERQETMSNKQFFLPLQFYNSTTKLGRRTRKFTIGFNRA
jgi:hypothetical protein